MNFLFYIIYYFRRFIDLLLFSSLIYIFKPVETINNGRSDFLFSMYSTFYFIQMMHSEGKIRAFLITINRTQLCQIYLIWRPFSTSFNGLLFVADTNKNKSAPIPQCHNILRTHINEPFLSLIWELSDTVIFAGSYNYVIVRYCIFYKFMKLFRRMISVENFGEFNFTISHIYNSYMQSSVMSIRIGFYNTWYIINYYLGIITCFKPSRFNVENDHTFVRIWKYIPPIIIHWLLL